MPRPPWIDAEALLASLGGDRALLGTLLELFVGENRRRLQSLQAALREGDALEVGRSAHGIKSGVTNFCAPSAVALAQSIEHAGRAGALGGVSEQVAQLQVCLSEMEEELQCIVETPRAARQERSC